MQHLDAARLAAFDHAPLTVDEQTHLAQCATCRTEHEALRRLVALSGQLVAADVAADHPRLVAWDQLARGLRAEGLLVTGEHAVADTPAGRLRQPADRKRTAAERPVSSQRWFQQLRQAVAALALVAGGALMGRTSRPAERAPATGAPAGAFSALTASGVGEFGSVEEASQVLSRAQHDYERASLWLAVHDPASRDSDVYRARLAALDQMMAASQAALREAPQDPVLNHYYLSAYSAREATLQALSGALPVDKVIARY